MRGHEDVTRITVGEAARVSAADYKNISSTTVIPCLSRRSWVGRGAQPSWAELRGPLWGSYACLGGPLGSWRLSWVPTGPRIPGGDKAPYEAVPRESIDAPVQVHFPFSFLAFSPSSTAHTPSRLLALTTTLPPCPSWGVEVCLGRAESLQEDVVSGRQEPPFRCLSPLVAGRGGRSGEHSRALVVRPALYSIGIAQG